MVNRLKLNEKTVREAENLGRDYQIFDTDVRGFSITIYPSGTLRATPLAQNTLGITEPEATTTPAEVATAPVQRRKGTKQEALIEMLLAPGGATIEEIATALEWAAHTVRGAMAGPLKKKLGLEVTSEKVEGRGRVYTLK